MHRYILQPYKGPASRHRCPQCNKPLTFVPYIDTQTGQLLHPTAGRCNHEVNCGYHLTPKQFFELTRMTDNRRLATDDRRLATDDRRQATGKYTITPKPVFTVDRCPPTADYVCPSLLNQSIAGAPRNYFFDFLHQLFGYDVALTLSRRYYIGNSKHWPGATVFWQIDAQQQIRAGKIMLYNPGTGKRVKQPFNHITWVHTALKQRQFVARQCLFGEHLLATSNKSVALVESEKTAIIASAYMPEYTWLATGGIGNLTEEKCAILKGRKVNLYPDLNAFDTWARKAAQLRHITRFTVADILEKDCCDEDLTSGFDLADYLIAMGTP